MSTLDMSSQPISSLAASMLDADNSAGNMDTYHHQHDSDSCGGSWWGFFFWWIIIALVLYFVLFALKPDFVLKKDDYGDCYDEIDQGKLLGSAIVISLIIIFVLWLFAWGFGYGHGQAW